MPRKKPLMSRREVKECIKSTRSIIAAWEKAGCPKDGIEIGGAFFKPLPFKELDGPKFWALAPPARFRIRASAGDYAGLYVSQIGGIPLGVHCGTKYFLHQQAGAATEFMEFAPALPAIVAHLKSKGCPTELEAPKKAAKAGK